MPLQGSLDAVVYEFGVGWIAHGWAWDPTAPEERLAVEIAAADTVIGSGQAAEFRQDLLTAGIGDGAVAFRIPLQSPALGHSEQQQLMLRRAGDGVAITPPKPFRLPRLLGAVDRVEGTLVVGWACDTARPEVAVAVEMLIDGEVAGRVVADLPRPLSAGGGARHGFEWVLPSGCADGQPHPFTARFANTGIDLESPVAEVFVLPGRFTPQMRRLVDLRDLAEQYLAAVQQDLRAEARALHAPRTRTVTELLLGSLEPAPAPELLQARDRDAAASGFA